MAEKEKPASHLVRATDLPKPEKSGKKLICTVRIGETWLTEGHWMVKHTGDGRFENGVASKLLKGKAEEMDDSRFESVLPSQEIGELTVYTPAPVFFDSYTDNGREHVKLRVLLGPRAEGRQLMQFVQERFFELIGSPPQLFTRAWGRVLINSDKTAAVMPYPGIGRPPSWFAEPQQMPSKSGKGPEFVVYYAVHRNGVDVEPG